MTGPLDSGLSAPWSVCALAIPYKCTLQPQDGTTRTTQRHLRCGFFAFPQASTYNTLFPQRRARMTNTSTGQTDEQQRYLEELSEFLRIPSVSTLSEHKGDVRRAAQWVADDLKRSGMENVRVIDTKGHPLVYADWLHAEGQPTVLIYGHYDVQPPDPLDLWHTSPFEPTVRDGNLF